MAAPISHPLEVRSGFDDDFVYRQDVVGATLRVPDQTGVDAPAATE
ncbi:hypothetical protein [Gemmata massiliana]|nr:hypothetical protein [Gemmata massiliana]